MNRKRLVLVVGIGGVLIAAFFRFNQKDLDDAVSPPVNASDVVDKSVS